ncbi:MAG: dephospho-CoA kinase [Christensenellales bacterium]|jgi:dephospho-CoA kinase
MIVIGLTGGIASGKTTAAEVLRRLGARVWDADEAARDAVRPGTEGYRALRARYAPGFFMPDGALDRRKLAQYVFGHPERVAELNRTLHPYILADMRERLRAFEDEGAAVAVIDVPLLFETGLDREVDEVWVVSCGEDAQRERMLRRGYTLEEADARIAAQMPDAERRRRADRVIDTSGPKDDTARYIEGLYLDMMEERRCEKP